MKINTKLTTIMLGIILVVVVGISSIVYGVYKKTLDESLKQSSASQNALIKQEVDSWFGSFFGLLENVGAAAKYVKGNEKAIMPLLETIKKSNDDISTVFWAGDVPYKDGGFFYDATGWVPNADYDQTSRDWFRLAKAQNKVIVTDPYVDLITNKLVVSASTVVKNFDSSSAGVAGIDILLTDLNTLVKSKKISTNGMSYMIDRTGLLIVADSDAAVLKANIFDMNLEEIKSEILNKDSNFGYFAKNKFYFSSVKMGHTDWVFVTFGPLSDIYGELWRFVGILVFIGIVAVIIAFILSFFMARNMSVPLIEAVKMAGKIASGELRENVEEAFLKRPDEFGKLAHAFQGMVQMLRKIIVDVNESSIQVTTGAEQLSASSQQISQGATEQAASVEEVSASMEEMSANIKQNADNALQTEKIAQKTYLSIEEGGKSVIETVEAMKQIASKINIIEEIARSTNMLALNASIEAARAGEYGKGFAVVASEVGKLAERSQKEAGEISSLSQNSVAIAEHAGTTIAAVIPEIKRTAELVQEISASSNEQTSGIEQITQAIMQLDKVIQTNASSAEESASMSEELAGQAKMLNDTISYFKIGTEEISKASQGSTNLDTKNKVYTIETDKSSVLRNTTPVKQTQIKKVEAVVSKSSDPISSKGNLPTKEVSANKKEAAKKTLKTEPTNIKGQGIHVILDDDVPSSGRDALDNEYQEF